VNDSGHGSVLRTCQRHSRRHVKAEGRTSGTTDVRSGEFDLSQLTHL
jgi:hypothetical protein